MGAEALDRENARKSSGAGRRTVPPNLASDELSSVRLVSFSTLNPRTSCVTRVVLSVHQ